jgi:hypothetical protein
MSRHRDAVAGAHVANVGPVRGGEQLGPVCLQELCKERCLVAHQVAKHRARRLALYTAAYGGLARRRVVS